MGSLTGHWQPTVEAVSERKPNMTFSNNQIQTSFDDALEALGSRRRRQLLVNLMEKNPRTVTKQVDEFDGETEQLLIRLHHVELPKLDELRYITWDRETGRIAKGRRFEEIRPFLELLVRNEDELPNDVL